MLYIIVILLMRVVQSLFSKAASMRLQGRVMFLHYLAYCQVISAALGLVLVLAANASFQIDWLTVTLSCVTGVSIVVGTLSSLKAMTSGTVVLSKLFATAGLLIPCIAGVFLFQESINLFQMGGILLFLYAAWLLIGCSKKIYAGFSAKTMLWLLAAMISEGVTMLSQKMFSMYVPDVPVSFYSFLSFAITGVLLMIVLIPVAKKEKGSFRPLPRALLVSGASLSVAVFVISQCSTVAAKTIPSILLFPITNGGGVLIAAVVSAVVYKERLTAKSVIGLTLGVTALVVINAFS